MKTNRQSFRMSPERKHLLRLEWISLVYLALFVLAVLAPSLVTRGLFGIAEQHVEEVLIFVFGLTGLATFSIYQRVMERKELEHQAAKTESERARRELVESYRYIGSVNRQIEVLKRLANETSHGIVESDRLRKDLLTTLTAEAAASVGATAAFIRYVEVAKGRTEYELAHAHDGVPGFRVSNKELVKVHDSGAAHAYIRSDDQTELLVVPSDHSDVPIRAFLVIPAVSTDATHVDTSLLKVFANQAGLLYHTLGKRRLQPPLQLVGETTKQVVGEIA